MEPHAYPDLWQRTLSLIQKSHYYDKETFDSWISKTELFKIDNGTAYIIYPTMITLNILNTSEGIQLIQSTLQEILNESVSVQFISKQDAKKLIPEVQLQTMDWIKRSIIFEIL